MSLESEGEATVTITNDFRPGVGMVDYAGQLYGIDLDVYEEELEPGEDPLQLPHIGADLRFVLLSNIDAAAIISDDDDEPVIDCWVANISDEIFVCERPDSLHDQYQMIIRHVYMLDRELFRQILISVVEGEDE
jgi:hypothetical protein